MKKIAIAGALVALSACATAVTGRDDPPRISFNSSLPLDDALGCVISHMSENNPFGYPFRGAIVRPNEAYEVHPTREIMAGGEPIFVAVQRAPGGVLVEGYSLERLARVFDGLDRACG